MDKLLWVAMAAALYAAPAGARAVAERTASMLPVPDSGDGEFPEPPTRGLRSARR